MNFGLFLAVEWDRAVGVELECVRLGGGNGSSGSAVGAGWLRLAGWLQWRHPILTRGQRSFPPGGGEKVLNWERFIQQSCPAFGKFQRHFWPMQHLCSCA